MTEAQSLGVVDELTALPALTRIDQHVVDIILEDIVEHIAVEMACEMHHAIKAGKFVERPKRRLDLYSEIHSSEAQMMESIKKYSTEEPLQKRKAFASVTDQDTMLDLDENDDEDARKTASSPCPTGANAISAASTTISDASANPIGGIVVTRLQQNQKDIWNRLPPKEPKALAKCSICDREVSVVRFAPHLDKCMQLGSLRGAAAAAAAASGSSSAFVGRGALK